MLKWTIYEVSSKSSKLHGVKFRGRTRVYGIDNNIDILTENATDAENTVRFALLDKKDLIDLKTMIGAIVPDAEIGEVLTQVENPVLSKLKVNFHERYRVE
jgi:hypothetical protein